MKDEFLGHISYQEYDAIDAIRGTYLSKFDECPAKAITPDDDTAALRFGRAAHVFILLGPEQFNREFAIPDQCAAILKSGKNKGQRCSNMGGSLYTLKLPSSSTDEWRCGIHTVQSESVNMQQEIISPDDFAHIQGMNNSIARHPTAPQIILDSDREQALTWTDVETGLACKALVDCIPKRGYGMVNNLKTCASADEFAFSRSVLSHNYHMSAAMTLEGLTIVTGDSWDMYALTAVEKKPPYRCEVFQLDESWIDAGRKQYHDTLVAVARARDKNEFPAWKYGEVKILVAPGYVEVE